MAFFDNFVDIKMSDIMGAYVETEKINAQAAYDPNRQAQLQSAAIAQPEMQSQTTEEVTAKNAGADLLAGIDKRILYGTGLVLAGLLAIKLIK